MNNTYAKERNLIFTTFQLVNRINDILTIKTNQTQLQIRAIQRLQRLQIYQVPHERRYVLLLNPLLIALY